MRLELKRDSILIIPETEVDRAFIEDSLNVKSNGDSLIAKRVENVSLGYQKSDEFVLKISPK